VGVVIAIDAGTTGVRAFAVDESGRPCGWEYQEFPQYFPRLGWVEHDPGEIWAAVQHTVGKLASALTDAGRTIATLGVTNQRETTVVWDRRRGTPLQRAIVWQDRRTAARCDALRESGHLPLVRATTGLVLDPYFSAAKLEWLLSQGGVERGPDLAFGTVDSWIVWNLTAGALHATDPSNASRTLLYDIRARRWSEEMTALFGVPASALPTVLPSSAPWGTVADDAIPGLPSGTPISGVAGDQQAALFGQACLTPGMTKNTFGTGSFVLMNIGDTCPEPVEGLLTTVAWTLGDASTAYALEGAIFVTGAAIQWLRDGLGVISQASEIGSLAASVPDAGGVVVVPAFTGLGSPWWDPYARGTILGLTRGTGRAHIARAVVEAMAHSTRDVVDAMTAAATRPSSTLRVDGGASVMDLLLQLCADQLQVSVARPQVQETTALGVAYLAGLGTGVWASPAEVADLWALDAEFHPAGPGAVADRSHAEWRRAVDRARGWAAGS